MEEQDYRPEEEQEKKPKEKKYVTRREFRICFVILLLFVFFQSLSIKENIQQAQNNVSNVVYSAENNISNTINSIPRNIEQGIEDANNPIRESSMEIMDVDVKARTATVRMTAAPKEYVDGMTMKFMVSCDGAEAMEVPAQAGNDRVFEAEMEVPFCGVVSASAHMRKGNTEYIRSVGSVDVENTVLPAFHGNWGGSVSWQANGDFVVFDGDIVVEAMTPEWLMQRDKGASFRLKDTKVEVYMDGKLEKTLPAILFSQDESVRSYQADFTGENKLSLKNGKKIEFIFKAEDNNGLCYSYLAETGRWKQGDGYESEVFEMDDHERLTIE